MGLLTPLYIIGLFGLAIPVLIHLIRRTPRGEQQFSSLMFLSPSPPRLTRRAQLDNLLLLLLRAIILLLLILAFARPFWRQLAAFSFEGARGRRIAVLIDTSASMRRDSLWKQSTQVVDDLLENAGDSDRIALYTFDEQVRAVVRFEELDLLPDKSRRDTVIRGKLGEIRPGWAATDLGKALVFVADVLDAENEGEQSEIDAKLQIVVVTDLQRGSELESLQSFEWPDAVMLDVRAVEPELSTNAGLHMVNIEPSADAVSASERVRVTNDIRSVDEQFWVYWSHEQSAKMDDNAVQVSVPPGESRVVKAPTRPADGKIDRLQLVGDDHVFDNTVFIAPLQRRDWTILYVGSDDAKDANGSRYYLERAFPETPTRKVILEHQPQHESLKTFLTPSAVVVAEPLEEDRLNELVKYLEAGGLVIAALRDVKTAESLAPLLTNDQIDFGEADVADYAMLGEIEFGHPMFVPFANPRYSDFTKIHFWKYRRVDLPNGAEIRVLARFDSGAPAVFEKSFGKQGRMYVFTSGWHPDDSQLALSSKFVPLLSSVLNSAVGGEIDTSFRIGQPIPLTQLLPDSSGYSITTPAGRNIKVDKLEETFRRTNYPGIYTLSTADGRSSKFAVNLQTEESLTSPLDIDELKQRGVNLGRQLTMQEEVERERQLRNTELERQQQIWRWLIVATIVILILETWLAGRLARRISSTA